MLLQCKILATSPVALPPPHNSDGERLVKVTTDGTLLACVPKSAITPADTIAIEQVAFFTKGFQELLLFCRGNGTTDLHGIFAIHGGKVDKVDLKEPPGYRISLESYCNAAQREVAEELNGYKIDPKRLTPADIFTAPKEKFRMRAALFLHEVLTFEAICHLLKVRNQEVANVKVATYEEVLRDRENILLSSNQAVDTKLLHFWQQKLTLPRTY